MRRNKLIRRIIPAVLSIALMLNTGFTPASMATESGISMEQATDVGASIGEIPFGDDSTEDTESEETSEEVATEASSEEEATEETSEETTEEASADAAETSEEDVGDGTLEDDVLELDGITPIPDDAVGGPLQDGPGKIVFSNPYDFGTDDYLHPHVAGEVSASPQIMYFVNSDTGRYTPIFCVEPGVTLKEEKNPNRHALTMDDFGNLSESTKKKLEILFGLCSGFTTVVKDSDSDDAKLNALATYWTYQCLIWHYVAGMGEGEMDTCVSTFRGGDHPLHYLYKEIMEKVETYDTIPSYAVASTDKLNNGVRYALALDANSGLYTAIIKDTTGMLAKGRVNLSPTGLTAADQQAITSAGLTFTQCDENGTPSSTGSYLKITCSNELPEVSGRNVILKQEKKDGVANPSNSSVYFSNGYEQDCVYINSQNRIVPCYFSLYTIDEAHLKLQKRSTMTFGEKLATYDYTGAKYGIYTDAACTTLATGKVFKLDIYGHNTNQPADPYLICDENGNSQEVAVQENTTYYVREIEAGQGFKLDNSVHIVNMGAAGSMVITSNEVPVCDPVQMNIFKTDEEGIEMIKDGREGEAAKYEIGGATLEGAIFKIDYYADYRDTQSDISIINPLSGRKGGHQATWYIKTIYNKNLKKYVARLDEEHITSYYDEENAVIQLSSPLYYNERNEVTIPLGTIFVSEVKAPDGYEELVEDGVMTDQFGEVTESVQQIRATVETTADGRTGATGAAAYVKSRDGRGELDPSTGKLTYYIVPQSGSPLAVNEAIIRGDVRLKKVDYEKQSNMAGVFFKITSSAGESHYIMTDSDGRYDSSATANAVDTNGYDQYFDADGNYIGPKNTKNIKEHMGLWFYGTADESLWDTDNIDDNRGAFRYDETYTIEEVPCPNNEDKYLYSGTFSVTEDTVLDIGTIYNVDKPSLTSLEYDADSQTHETLAGKEAEVHIRDTVTYKNLKENTEYTMKGILMELNQKGKVVGPIKDINGEPVMAVKTFITGVSDNNIIPYVNGEVELAFDCTLSVTSGKKFVVFDYLYEGTDERPLTVSEGGTVESTGALAAHEDPSDENQIGYFTLRARVRVFKTGPFITGTEDTDTVLPNGETVTVKHLKFEQLAFAGIEFTVFDAKTDEAVTTFVTGADGMAVSDYINYDADNTKYYVMETKTPAGLVQDTTKYEIDFSEYDTDDVAFMNEPVKVENGVSSVCLSLYKEGDVLVPHKNDSFGIAGTGIPGVYFGIFTAEDICNNHGNVVVKADTLVGLAKTDEYGKAVVSEKLVAGKYYYKELCAASEEYVLEETRYSFEIKYRENSPEEVIPLDLNSAAPVYNTYKKQGVQLRKVDEEGASIPGVEFDLYRDVDDEYIRIGHYKTDDNGLITIEEVPFGKYYFIETKGVKGFEFDGTTHHEFEISDETIGTKQNITITAINKRKVSEKPDTPKTGDEAPIMQLIVLAIAVFALGLVGYFVLRRKKEK